MEMDHGLRTVVGACPHDCPDTCSLLTTVQGERIVSVKGNPEHPHTAGVLCTKVSRYAERVDHPERVLTPLRRTGPKGSGRFEPVGWDDALDDIAARLKAIAARNPEAILPYSYAGTMGLVQGEAMAARFFHKLGASLLDRTICASAGAAGLTAVYGGKLGMHVQHFARSRLIIIWGSNSIASNLHFWSLAMQARRDGATLWCIDPRKTETAEKCHHHLQLRPGTDGALALALMHQLIVHDWLDHDYIEHHVEGYGALRERALDWTPERAAAVCGLDPLDIRELARQYGLSRPGGASTSAKTADEAGPRGPAAIRLNYGMQRARGGGNAVRLVALLPCLIGAWRDPAGGMLLSSSSWALPHRNDAVLQRPELLGQRRPRTINMSTIGDDLLRQSSAAFGPRIEALLVYNSNPLAVAPESAKVAQGLRRADLFTVVLEHFMTDTADHADYVLPATTQLEHWDVHTSYGHTDVLLNQPAVAPRGQARSNARIFAALALRMGYTDEWFLEDDETLARQALRNIDFEQLQQHGWLNLGLPEAPFARGGFHTPDGRARVHAPGLDAPDYLPNYECEASEPELARRYPLAMISPPARHFLNSTFVNVRSLRSIEGEPIVEIHPEDAARRGIEDGQRVSVFNDRGSHGCKARVTGRARPGVVNGLGVWWRKFGLDGHNMNELTHQHLSDLGRAPCFYDCLVEVRKQDR